MSVQNSNWWIDGQAARCSVLPTPLLLLLAGRLLAGVGALHIPPTLRLLLEVPPSRHPLLLLAQVLRHAPAGGALHHTLLPPRHLTQPHFLAAHWKLSTARPAHVSPIWNCVKALLALHTGRVGSSYWRPPATGGHSFAPPRAARYRLGPHKKLWILVLEFLVQSCGPEI